MFIDHKTKFKFISITTKHANKRTDQDLYYLQNFLNEKNIFSSDELSDSIYNTEYASKYAIYEVHGANDILYCRGEFADRWYILLSGSVRIVGEPPILPYKIFGQRTNGSIKRSKECTVLEYSEFLVIPYPKNKNKISMIHSTQTMTDNAVKSIDENIINTNLLLYTQDNNFNSKENGITKNNVSHPHYSSNSLGRSRTKRHNLNNMTQKDKEQKDIIFEGFATNNFPTSQTFCHENADCYGNNNLNKNGDINENCMDNFLNSKFSRDANGTNEVFIPIRLSSSPSSLKIRKTSKFNDSDGNEEDSTINMNDYDKFILPCSTNFTNSEEHTENNFRHCMECHPLQRTPEDLHYMVGVLLSCLTNHKTDSAFSENDSTNSNSKSGKLNKDEQILTTLALSLLNLFLRLQRMAPVRMPKTIVNDNDEYSHVRNEIYNCLLTNSEFRTAYISFLSEVCRKALFAEVQNTETTNTTVLNVGERLDSWCIVYSGQLIITANAYNNDDLESSPYESNTTFTFDDSEQTKQKYRGGDVSIQLNAGDTFGIRPNLRAQYFEACMKTLSANCCFICIGQYDYYQLWQEYGVLSTHEISPTRANYGENDTTAAFFDRYITDDDNESNMSFLEDTTSSWPDDTIFDDEDLSEDHDDFKALEDHHCDFRLQQTNSQPTNSYFDDFDCENMYAYPSINKVNQHDSRINKLSSDVFNTTYQTDYHGINEGKHNYKSAQHQYQEPNLKNIVVKKGTLTQLINYLVSDEIANLSVFMENILLTYRIFLDSPNHLMRKLFKWFNTPDNNNVNSYKIKATKILLLWVNNHFCDFEKIPWMMDYLEEYESLLETEKMQGQLTLLNMACVSKAKPRTIILNRSMRDEVLHFSILGGWERNCPIFVSKVEKHSKAHKMGLRRGDQILEVNGQNFDYISHTRALDIFRNSTHLCIVVKSNISGLKQFITMSSVTGSPKHLPPIQSNPIPLPPRKSTSTCFQALQENDYHKNSEHFNKATNDSLCPQHLDTSFESSHKTEKSNQLTSLHNMSFNSLGPKKFFNAMVWKNRKNKFKQVILSSVSTAAINANSNNRLDITKQHFCVPTDMKNDLNRSNSGSSPSIDSSNFSGNYDIDGTSLESQNLKSLMHLSTNTHYKIKPSSLSKSANPYNCDIQTHRKRFSISSSHNSSLMDEDGFLCETSSLVSQNKLLFLHPEHNKNKNVVDKSLNNNNNTLRTNKKSIALIKQQHNSGSVGNIHSIKPLSLASSTSKSKFSSILNGGPMAPHPEYVIKVYRNINDSAFKYLLIHKETSAKEVVMLTLREFGITDSSSFYALFEVSLQNGGVLKRKRLPDHLTNLADRLNLNARYYIKRNISTSTTTTSGTGMNLTANNNCTSLNSGKPSLPSTFSKLTKYKLLNNYNNNNLQSTNQSLNKTETINHATSQTNDSIALINDDGGGSLSDKNLATELLVEGGLEIENVGSTKETFKIPLLTLPCAELAILLTLRDFFYFRRIEASEYINNLFELPNDKLKLSPLDNEIDNTANDFNHDESFVVPPSFFATQNLLEFEKLVDKEMFWVVYEIVSETKSLLKRCKKIKFFIKLAQYCRALRNYNTTFAICSGLCHNSVSRLDLTWAKLPTKYRFIIEELKKLLDPSRNMANYRSVLRKSAHVTPLIPFFPLFKKDLTFIHLGNSTFIEDDDKNSKDIVPEVADESQTIEKRVINFDKLSCVAREIRRLQQMQSVTLEMAQALDGLGGPFALPTYQVMIDNWPGCKPPSVSNSNTDIIQDQQSSTLVLTTGGCDNDSSKLSGHLSPKIDENNTDSLSISNSNDTKHCITNDVKNNRTTSLYITTQNNVSTSLNNSPQCQEKKLHVPSTTHTKSNVFSTSLKKIKEGYATSTSIEENSSKLDNYAKPLKTKLSWKQKRNAHLKEKQTIVMEPVVIGGHNRRFSTGSEILDRELSKVFSPSALTCDPNSAIPQSTTFSSSTLKKRIPSIDIQRTGATSQQGICTQDNDGITTQNTLNKKKSLSVSKHFNFSTIDVVLPGIVAQNSNNPGQTHIPPNPKKIYENAQSLRRVRTYILSVLDACGRDHNNNTSTIKDTKKPKTNSETFQDLYNISSWSNCPPIMDEDTLLQLSYACEPPNNGNITISGPNVMPQSSSVTNDQTDGLNTALFSSLSIWKNFPKLMMTGKSTNLNPSHNDALRKQRLAAQREKQIIAAMYQSNPSTSETKHSLIPSTLKRNNSIQHYTDNPYLKSNNINKPGQFLTQFAKTKWPITAVSGSSTINSNNLAEHIQQLYPPVFSKVLKKQLNSTNISPSKSSYKHHIGSTECPQSMERLMFLSERTKYKAATILPPPQTTNNSRNIPIQIGHQSRNLLNKPPHPYLNSSTSNSQHLNVQKQPLTHNFHAKTCSFSKNVLPTSLQCDTKSNYDLANFNMGINLVNVTCPPIVIVMSTNSISHTTTVSHLNIGCTSHYTMSKTTLQTQHVSQRSLDDDNESQLSRTSQYYSSHDSQSSGSRIFQSLDSGKGSSELSFSKSAQFTEISTFSSTNLEMNTYLSNKLEPKYMELMGDEINKTKRLSYSPENNSEFNNQNQRPLSSPNDHTDLTINFANHEERDSPTTLKRK